MTNFHTSFQTSPEERVVRDVWESSLLNSAVGGGNELRCPAIATLSQSSQAEDGHLAGTSGIAQEAWNPNTTTGLHYFMGAGDFGLYDETSSTHIPTASDQRRQSYLVDRRAASQNPCPPPQIAAMCCSVGSEGPAQIDLSHPTSIITNEQHDSPREVSFKIPLSRRTNISKETFRGTNTQQEVYSADNPEIPPARRRTPAQPNINYIRDSMPPMSPRPRFAVLPQAAMKGSPQEMNSTALMCLRSPECEPPESNFPEFDSRPRRISVRRVPGQAGTEWSRLSSSDAIEFAHEQAMSEGKSISLYVQERRAIRAAMKHEREMANSRCLQSSFFTGANGPSPTSSSIAALNKLFDKYRGMIMSNLLWACSIFADCDNPR